MPGSMSGEEKRSDGLLGERSNERRRAHLAPPVLYATALLLDSTGQVYERMHDCYNNYTGNFLVNITSWNVQNPGVASASTIGTGSGRATGNSEGSSYAPAFFNGDFYTLQPGDICSYDSYPVEAPSSLYGTAATNPDPVKLQECLNVCNQGITAIEQFCRALPDPRWRALCWAARWSATACRGFCYLIWGS